MEENEQLQAINKRLTVENLEITEAFRNQNGALTNLDGRFQGCLGG